MTSQPSHPRRPTLGQGTLVGMVHLLPLPGSPRWEGGAEAMARVVARARADAETLLSHGMDGVLVENFGDLPFLPGRVEPETCAAMTRAVLAVQEVAEGRLVGVNVLRNDAATALGIAAATGAHLVRVNVHVGAMHTDQGLLEGAAHDTLRRRRWLGVGPEDAGAAVVAGAAESAGARGVAGAPGDARAAVVAGAAGVARTPGAARAPGVLIAADVHVKHAIPPAGATLEDTARDLVGRGLADLLVVSGRGTGLPTDPDRPRQVREAAPHTPIWVGSGVTPETVAGLFQLADGAIVGSALQEEGRAGRPVEAARVRALVTAARG